MSNIKRNKAADEESEFFDQSSIGGMFDFDEMYSLKFANIERIYESPNGPTELYTATRQGKRYILKGLKEQYRLEPLHLMALKKEYDIGSRLNHPNIRRTESLEEVDGLGKVLVLEYIDGRSLKDVLHNEKPTVEQVYQIAGQLLRAMGYVHAHGMLHRDLKPANIMLGYESNMVKIIDFNLSDGDEYVILKNSAGTPRYMDPWRDTGGGSSVADDIYSLGVIFGELAANCGDRKLRELSAKMTNPRLERRPRAVADIILQKPEGKMGKALDSKIFTFILSASAIALAAFITYCLIN